MKKNYNYLIAVVILFSCLCAGFFSARCEAAGTDIDCYFYGVKYLEKIAEKSQDPIFKTIEAVFPAAFNTLKILRDAADLTKAGDLKGAISSFCVSIAIDGTSPPKLVFYIALDCKGGRASAVLERLSGAAVRDDKKTALAGGFSGFLAGPGCAFITSDEKIGADPAGVMAKAFITELNSASGIEEKVVIHKSKFVSDQVTGYINRSMLSLLDRVYEKTEKFEIEVIDDDNARLNICFPDEMALAANYEVIVGYKDLFGALTIGNAEFAKMKKNGPAGNYSPEFSGEMSGFFSDMASLSKKITHKVEGKKLVFTIPELKKINELNEKVVKMSAKERAGKAENPAKSCLRNMKTIEGAAELFMMETPKIEKPVSVETLVAKEYLKKSPQCPEGGSYSIECRMKDTAVESFKLKCSRHGYLDEMK